VARSGLGTLEGMYKLAPYNEAALPPHEGLGGTTSAFTEDELEEARKGRTPSSRSTTEHSPSRLPASTLLRHPAFEAKSAGFDEATRNADTMTPT